MIIQANALHLPIASNSVQCCVTSPPYYGLRSYGIPPEVWGGHLDCEHEWGSTVAINATNHTDKRRWQHTRNWRDEEQPPEKRVAWLRTTVPQGKFCQHCGAWVGCLGLEPSPVPAQCHGFCRSTSKETEPHDLTVRKSHGPRKPVSRRAVPRQTEPGRGSALPPCSLQRSHGAGDSGGKEDADSESL